jgi:gas vesicle protein
MPLEPISLALGILLGSICGYLLGLLLEAERGSLELAKYNDLKAEVERLGIELSKIDKREALRDLEERMRSVEEEIDEIIRRSRGR